MSSTAPHDDDDDDDDDNAVFQITFKGRLPTRSFEGFIDVSPHTFSSLPS